MALAGFKIAVNHCIRPFQSVPIALYTDIPLAYIKCIPEHPGKQPGLEDHIESSGILETVYQWAQDFFRHIGMENTAFRFEIKTLPHSYFNSELELISILTGVLTILNEWLHHPMEKNDLLAWLIEKNKFQNAEIISACMYGGIMSNIEIRPFRIYQPKGLFFQIESISTGEVKLLTSSLIPLFILAIERSDYNSMHDLLAKTHPVENMQEGYLGVLDLPDLKSRLHIYNISTPDLSSLNISGHLSPVFEIDSNGCSVV